MGIILTLVPIVLRVRATARYAPVAFAHFAKIPSYLTTAPKSVRYALLRMQSPVVHSQTLQSVASPITVAVHFAGRVYFSAIHAQTQPYASNATMDTYYNTKILCVVVVPTVDLVKELFTTVHPAGTAFS